MSTAMVVLPVWRSPMISSRWPRPIGIMLSMAFKPVRMGSLTDLREMIPVRAEEARCTHSGTAARSRTGRLDLDKHLGAAGLVGGCSTVDGVAQRIDDTANQIRADAHLARAAPAISRRALRHGTDMLRTLNMSRVRCAMEPSRM